MPEKSLLPHRYFRRSLICVAKDGMSVKRRHVKNVVRRVSCPLGMQRIRGGADCVSVRNPHPTKKRYKDGAQDAESLCRQRGRGWSADVQDAPESLYSGVERG